MKINSAVLLMMFLLVAAAGWLAAGAASPKLVTLLMGVAIGMIVSMPITLLLARALWSDQMRVTRRRERRRWENPYGQTGGYPPIIVVRSPMGEAADYGQVVYPPDEEAYEPPPVYYLGEE
jgi:hypothetical protein